jgi:transcriptional regulator with XRE-family HTH domain
MRASYSAGQTRRFRQSLGLSQEKTAEICQVARHYIAHVEIGRCMHNCAGQGRSRGVVLNVSLKHIGFVEEREWRVIYIPDVNRSELIAPGIEVIGGVPQIIFKVPLEEMPSKNVIGVGIPALVDRVIIGPTAYPGPMYSAFVAVLEGAGVPDARSRVVLSGIPLRQ